MNPVRFRAILAELIDENPFAIRAVLRTSFSERGSGPTHSSSDSRVCQTGITDSLRRYCCISSSTRSAENTPRSVLRRIRRPSGRVSSTWRGVDGVEGASVK